MWSDGDAEGVCPGWLYPDAESGAVGTMAARWTDEVLRTGVRRPKTTSALRSGQSRLRVFFQHIRSTGGYTPVERRRAPRCLSLAEREEISRGLTADKSIRSIARALGRAASPISREMKRNGGVRRYRTVKADKRAWKQVLRPKPCKLAMRDALRQAVVCKLQRQWSPQQIAGWLARTHSGQEALNVSNETIYRSLYVQVRGVLKKELVQFLRTCRQLRGSRHKLKGKDPRGQIKDAVSISERPPSVEDRAIPGQWEGDLICGPSIALSSRSWSATRDMSCWPKWLTDEPRRSLMFSSSRLAAFQTNTTSLSHGMEAMNWPSIDASLWKQMSRFTSVIRKALSTSED